MTIAKTLLDKLEDHIEQNILNEMQIARLRQEVVEKDAELEGAKSQIEALSMKPEERLEEIKEALDRMTSILKSNVLYHDDSNNNTPRIQAIKALRTMTGLGLKDAKDIIDAAFPRNFNKL